MGVLYSKANYGRKKEFRILTTVEESEGRYCVFKQALGAESHTWLRKIGENSRFLSSWKFKNFTVLPYQDTHDGKIACEYIRSESLESEVLNAILKRDFRKHDQLILDFGNRVQEESSLVQLMPNDESSKWFPNFSRQERAHCIAWLPYDLNFDNIFPLGNKWVIIDPEFAFSFYIPVDLFLTRSLFYLAAKFQVVYRSFCSKQFPLYQYSDWFLVPKSVWEIFNQSTFSLKEFSYIENCFQSRVVNMSTEIETDFIEQPIEKTEHLFQSIYEKQVLSEAKLNRIRRIPGYQVVSNFLKWLSI
jgi:hypothetical protein